MESTQAAVTEFKWGKKRGIGGKKKDVQFYETFTLNGVDYSLYDPVYLFGKGEDDPYIGLIIKLWEDGGGAKKVKILWFFHPYEISAFIGSEEIVENELFLACGEGVGLTNINPLEAISGKCNVECKINGRKINLQPGKSSGNFMVYRAFDVGRRIVVNELDDKVAGIDVKDLLSRIGRQEICTNPRPNVENTMAIPIDADTDTKKVSYEDGNDRCATSCRIQSPNLGEGITCDQNGSDKVILNLPVGRNAISHRFSAENQRPALHEYIGVGESLLSGQGKFTGNNTCEKLVDDGSINSGRPEQPKLDGFVAPITSSGYPDLSTMHITAQGNDVMNQDSETNQRNGSVEAYGQQIDTDKDIDKSHGPASLRAVLSKEMVVKEENFMDGWSSKPLSKQDLDKIYESTKNLQRPNIDKHKWFKISWDERLRIEHGKGTLVLLSNLDPSFNGTEVEDIIQKAFNITCSAKRIQPTSYITSYFGHAFAIFATKQDAQIVVRRLTEDCLLLPNERPLIGSFETPCFPNTKAPLCGHFDIDDSTNQPRSEMKEAACTSHCSQPNTIEYGMAKEWCERHERSYQQLRSLSQIHRAELRSLKAALLSK